MVNNSSESLIAQLRGIRFSRFIFRISPETEITLGRFIGNTIRGGFGYSFRDISCIDREKGFCSHCTHAGDCIYNRFFESKLQVTGPGIKSSEIPRPYLFDWLPGGRQTVSRREIFEIRLTLIGKSIPHLPIFIKAFNRLGRSGFGYMDKKFSVLEVLQEYPSKKVIYEGLDEAMKLPEEGYLDESFPANCRELTVVMVTPMRIKYNGKLASDIHFHFLLRSLIHRLTFISGQWCGIRIDYDWKKMIEKAGEVGVKEKNTGWVDLERHSTRQNSSMKMGGVVGTITYKGELEELLPLITLGAHLHAGKNTTFGLGRYIVLFQ